MERSLHAGTGTVTQLHPFRYNPDMHRTMEKQVSFIDPWEERNGLSW